MNIHSPYDGFDSIKISSQLHEFASCWPFHCVKPSYPSVTQEFAAIETTITNEANRSAAAVVMIVVMKVATVVVMVGVVMVVVMVRVSPVAIVVAEMVVAVVTFAKAELALTLVILVVVPNQCRVAVVNYLMTTSTKPVVDQTY